MFSEFGITRLLIGASFALFLVEEFVASEPEETCKSKGKPGKCIPVGNCPAAMGDLSSGIYPQMCPSKNVKSASELPSICCPTKPRISAGWCQKYIKEVLMEPLVMDGNKKGPLTVRCETFLSPFISGGRDAANREYPHQVALGYAEAKSNVSWKCGGTLISNQFVLTAGHCVSKDNKSGLPKKILLGDTILSEKDSDARQIVDIADIIPNPEHKPPIVYNDIALIKMQSKVNLSRSILPACMPQPEDRLDKILHVTATGWGQLGAVESQSDKLQTVDLTKFSLKNCSAYFKDDAGMKLRLPYGIVRSQICAGDMFGIKDTCRGDSGGPITVNKAEPCVYYLVGVTSFGNNYCGYQQPGVYTNVLRYLDWIESVVWNGESPPSADRDHALVYNLPATTADHPHTDPTRKPTDNKNPKLYLTDDRTEPSRVKTTPVPTVTTPVPTVTTPVPTVPTPVPTVTASGTLNPSTNLPANTPANPTLATSASETKGTTFKPKSSTGTGLSVSLSTAKPYFSIDEMANKFIDLKKSHLLDSAELKKLTDGYPVLDESSLGNSLASNKNIHDIVANVLFTG